MSRRQHHHPQTDSLSDSHRESLPPRPDSVSSSNLEVPSRHRSRGSGSHRAKEEPHHDRDDPKLDARSLAILDILDRVRKIVMIEGGKGDPFGTLALSMLEKELKSVDVALQIIKDSWREAKAFKKAQEESGSARRDDRPSRSMSTKTETQPEPDEGHGRELPAFAVSSAPPPPGFASEEESRSSLLTRPMPVSFGRHSSSHRAVEHGNDSQEGTPLPSSRRGSVATSAQGEVESDTNSTRSRPASTFFSSVKSFVKRPSRDPAEPTDMSSGDPTDATIDAPPVAAPPFRDAFANLVRDVAPSFRRQPSHASQEDFREPLPPVVSPRETLKSARHSELSPIITDAIPSQRNAVPERRTPSRQTSESHQHPNEEDSRRSRRSQRSAPPAAVASDSEDSAATSRARRSRSKARNKSKSRSGTANSEALRRTLESASAPPPEPAVQQLLDLPDSAFLGRVIDALAEEGAIQTLSAVALVSKRMNRIASPALYRTLRLVSLDMAAGLEDNTQLSHVRHLVISPLDASGPTIEIPTLIGGLRALLTACPNLESLKEDFTQNEWDVKTLADYPLILQPGGQMRTFESRRCWWEIDTLTELFKGVEVEKLVFGGAIMDREWAGQRILAGPKEVFFPRLTSLEIAQVAHEDTLEVMLRSCGPHLRSLRIGFQSIGSTDEDTPRSRIVPALEHVSASLTHFAVRAPLQASQDAAGLLDLCIAALPKLEILEFSEQGDLLPVPIVTAEVLSHLPGSLRVLRATGLVSITTTAVLAMLDKPEGIPVLERIDLVWSEDDEGAWKERHKSRLDEACEELGIVGRFRKGGELLQFRDWD